MRRPMRDGPRSPRLDRLWYGSGARLETLGTAQAGFAAMFDTKFGAGTEMQTIDGIPMDDRRSEDETAEGKVLDYSTRMRSVHHVGFGFVQ